ncbi:transposase [Rubidibacter lacunae]|uniref:transposase n=1 Tax=Rubidibacter lacunae TaxID=582514 RepID=UPI000412880C
MGCSNSSPPVWSNTPSQANLPTPLQEQAADPEALPNSRNGDSRQTVQCNQGSLELQIPRDRRSEFTPAL